MFDGKSHLNKNKLYGLFVDGESEGFVNVAGYILHSITH